MGEQERYYIQRCTKDGEEIGPYYRLDDAQLTAETLWSITRDSWRVVRQYSIHEVTAVYGEIL